MPPPVIRKQKVTINQCCGCSNLTTVHNDRTSARDMSKVIMLGNMEVINLKAFLVGKN